VNKWIVGVGLVFLLGEVSPTLAIEGNLTISDREIIERLTRLEEGQKALQEQMVAGQNSLQSQINGLQSQINGLQNLIVGGFGVIFVGIFGLFGFVIWDRRSAISPVVRKAKELEEREDLTIRVLKDYARKESKLAEIMKSYELM